MPQPFEIDNTKRLYLLETDETYSIDSFKITHYFEISDLRWKSEKTQESFPSAGRLNINVNKAFKIDYDNNGDVTNREVFTEYNKTYESTGKKLFLINEEIIDSNNVQYLYSNEDDNEKTFEIQSRKIELNKCKKQPFETFMQIELSDDEFIRRVNAVETYLNPLKDRIRSLYEDIQYTKGGGSKHTLNINENINKKFHSMIDLYIKCVNEILNVSLFKKVFYISHLISNDNVLDGDALKLIKQFNYVGISFDSLGQTNLDELDMNYKEYFSGLYLKNRNESEDIQNRFSEIVNKDNKIEEDQAYQDVFLTSKYTVDDLTNMKIYNVKYFVDKILKPITKKENYHKIYKDKENEQKKRLSRFFYFILEIIEKEMKSIDLLLYKETQDNASKEHSLLVENLKRIETQKNINSIIGGVMDTNILTYLKIRNDQHKKENYNARFQIKLHTPSTETASRRVMELNYSDDNKKYYEKNEDNDIEPIQHDNLYTIDEEGGYKVINPNKRDNYPRKYVFGEFNKIFTPEKSNQDIAEQATEITINLKEGRPVFIIGYGASGAGKTSSLIYFNKTKEDGILVEICNIMGREGYTNASIKSCEIYRDASVEDAEKDITKNPKDLNGNAISFSYNNGFKLDADLKYENHHIFRARKQEQRKKEKKLKETVEEVKSLTIEDCEESITTTFKKGSQLGEYLIHIIDTDRHVKATTNNPNSSRSHSLVFVKLSGEGKKDAHLIVGDFAGVENVFNCDDPSVLNDFMKIEADDKSGLFYKNEVCDDKLDPIGNTAEKKGKGKEKEGGGIYNFGKPLNDQPFSYSKFGQLSQLVETIQEQTILQNYFVEVVDEKTRKFKNIQMFERAVRLIRSIAGIQLDNGEEKDLIEKENFDTFKTYSKLENSENNVWKKAKDGWNSYRESVKNIKIMINANKEDDKNSNLIAELYGLIDETIDLTKSLDSNSVIATPKSTSIGFSNDIIRLFNNKKKGTFYPKDYKDNLFWFFNQVIENSENQDLKKKIK